MSNGKWGISWDISLTGRALSSLFFFVGNGAGWQVHLMFFFTSHPTADSRLPARTPVDSPQGSHWLSRAHVIWIVLALASCAWLLPGIIGHGPWKQDETYTFGIVHHMLVSGDYLVPTNAGEPFMEKPPLYYWTAALTAQALYPWLDYHDGARVASVLFNLLTLAFVARIALLLWPGQKLRSWPVLGTLAFYAGAPGLVKHAHDMFTDVALVSGAAMATCGLLEIALDQQRQAGARPVSPASTWRPALCFGLGVGIAQMSKGLFSPLIFAATAAVLPLLVPSCRSRAYARMVGLAVLVSLPFFLIWPALLAQHSMPLFMEWFWDNNVGRFFGFSVHKLGSDNDHTVILRALTGFALPGALLTLLALARGRWRDIADPRMALPLCFVIISIAVLQSSATARQLYLLPVLLPLAMAGSQVVPRLPLWAHQAWDWCARGLFGLLALAIWVVWAISTLPEQPYHHFIALVGKWLPLDFVTPVEPLAIFFALAMTLGWMWALTQFPRAGKWRGAVSWFSGITLMWGLAFTLLLPWADYAKSYAYVYDDLDEKLATAWRSGDCMASQVLGESEAPMLYYYTGVLHQRLEGRTTPCRWLIQGTPGKTALPTGHWEEFWAGQREGDAQQLLKVWRRVD